MFTNLNKKIRVKKAKEVVKTEEYVEQKNQDSVKERKFILSIYEDLKKLDGTKAKIYRGHDEFWGAIYKWTTIKVIDNSDRWGSNIRINFTRKFLWLIPYACEFFSISYCRWAKDNKHYQLYANKYHNFSNKKDLLNKLEELLVEMSEEIIEPNNV